MKTILLTQKSICAFLGLMMALTIVWKANLEMKEMKAENVTARIETTKPTISVRNHQIGALMHYEENRCQENLFSA